MTHILMSYFKRRILKKAQKDENQFSKRNRRKCRPRKGRIKQNNDHTRIVRKIPFCSSFKRKVFLKKGSKKMLFARCTNYLNRENSDSVKAISGLVITLRTK